MDLNEAVATAERALRGAERADLPLRQAPREFWLERSWCYVFPFNTVAFFDHNDLRNSIPAGPLVVPKDGTTPWGAPSAPPIERFLEAYEQEHGISG